MDMFVSVGVFAVVCFLVLMGYWYYKIEVKGVKERKAAADAAWKKEQARQRRAAKKAGVVLQSNNIQGNPLENSAAKGNWPYKNPIVENVLGQGRSDWTQQ